MSRPIKTIHNVETGEIIERELNDNEFAQYEADQEADVQRKLAKEAKAQARATAQAKLAALGFTVEDLQALGL